MDISQRVPSPPKPLARPRPAEDADGAYFCEQCERRFGGPGDCAHCDGEPLLDLLDEDVLLLLTQFDEQRWRKRAGLYIGVGVVMAIPVFGVVLLVSTKGAVIASAAVVAVVTGALLKVFPPPKKCPQMGQSF